MKKKLLSLAAVWIMLFPASICAATGDKVIKTGEKYLGRPYSYGAPLGNVSKFDCSSFVAQVFKENGVTLPRTSREQITRGAAISEQHVQKGDLMFYDTDSDGVINHVGIYAGAERVIMAASSKGVSYTTTDNPYWKPRYVSARRVLPIKPAPVLKKFPSVPADLHWKNSLEKKSRTLKLKRVNHLESTFIRLSQKPMFSTFKKELFVFHD